MTLNELKAHIEDLLNGGVDGNTPLKIRENDSNRYTDMHIEFAEIKIDDKNKMSEVGEDALTCFWLTE